MLSPATSGVARCRTSTDINHTIGILVIADDNGGTHDLDGNVCHGGLGRRWCFQELNILGGDEGRGGRIRRQHPIR